MTACLPADQACAYLPHRSPADVRARDRTLGVDRCPLHAASAAPMPLHRPWSAAERERLQRACEANGVRAIFDAAPHRHPHEIAGQLLVMSILASDDDATWRATNDAVLGAWPTRAARALGYAAKTMTGAGTLPSTETDRGDGFTLDAGRALPGTT